MKGTILGKRDVFIVHICMVGSKFKLGEGKSQATLGAGSAGASTSFQPSYVSNQLAKQVGKPLIAVSHLKS